MINELDTNAIAAANIEQAIDDCDAEAWIVACSTASHVPVAKQLLANGHCVLIEKPIADTLAHSEELAKFVAPDSGNLMVGHTLLFSVEFHQLCEETHRRGPIAYIDSVRHRPVHIMRLFPGESPYRLLMVHDMYVVSVLMDGVEPSCITAQCRRTKSGECDLAVAQMQWPNGTVANLVATYLTPTGMPEDGFDRLEVFGEGWAARMTPNPTPFQLWDDRVRFPVNAGARIASNGVTGMLAEELRCFCRVVRGQQKIPTGATYGAAVQLQRWMDRLESAAQSS